MNQTTFSFPRMVDMRTRKTQLSSTYKSINECLSVLLRTRKGELLGDPNYGCNLLERVFMYNGVIVEQLIKEDIVDAISKYEPRINITTNDIYIEKDTRTIRIYLQYEIKTSGEINEFNLEITDSDNPYRQ